MAYSTLIYTTDLKINILKHLIFIGSYMRFLDDDRWDVIAKTARIN
jgi:hypothetical protein